MGSTGGIRDYASRNERDRTRKRGWRAKAAGRSGVPERVTLSPPRASETSPAEVDTDHGHSLATPSPHGAAVVMLFRDKPRRIFVRSLNIHQGVTRAMRCVVLHIGVSGFHSATHGRAARTSTGSPRLALSAFSSPAKQPWEPAGEVRCALGSAGMGGGRGKSGIDHRAAGTERTRGDRRGSAAAAAAAASATAAATGGRGRSAATGHGNGGEQLDGVAVALRAGRRGGGLPHRATDLEGGAAGAATVLITRHPTSVGPLSRGV